MIHKLDPLSVGFEKTALLGLGGAFNPMSTWRAVMNAGLSDFRGAAKAALTSRGLQRDAASLATHAGVDAPKIPSMRQAFMGHLYEQEAGKQHSALQASQKRLQAAGHEAPPLYNPNMQGPAIAPNAVPTNMEQAHHRIAEKMRPQPRNYPSLDLAKYHPSTWLGGAGAVGGLAASDTPEELPQNVASGLGAGLAGGMALRALKHASLNPSMNIGPIGMGVKPDTERLPGTYRSVPTSVIQRVGEGMDRGMSADEAVAYGAKAPEISMAPILGTVAGALGGHYVHPGVQGVLIGGALGYLGGATAKTQLQKDYHQDAQTALQGLAIERSRMGMR